MKKIISYMHLPILLMMLLLQSSSIFAKSIDLNGLSVTLNVETVKENEVSGFDVKTTDNYSTSEYDKEKKEIKDKSIKATLIVKNTNPYESASITISEKINTSFKQVGVDSAGKTINVKLAPNESKEFKNTYKYNKSFLKEQFNKLFLSDNESIDYDDKNISISDKERNKNKYDIDNGNKVKNAGIKKRGVKNSIFLIIIVSVFAAFIVFILYIVFFKKVKDFDDNIDFKGFNAFVIFVCLSLVVGICKTNIYASSYEIEIYEPNKEFKRTISEIVSYDGRNYEFAYEITLKYSDSGIVPNYDIDSDGDGLTDGMEYLYMTDKDNIDTDGDGLSDYIEVMILNYNPRSKWTFDDGRSDGNRDFDGDGLRNIKELEYGTDMTNKDSDGDNLSDYDEIYKYETDPLEKDSDSDGLNDDVEIKLGLDPNNQKTDGSTLDSMRLIKQEYNNLLIPENLKNSDIAIKTISGTVNGDIDTKIVLSEYNDSNIENNEAVVSQTFNVENDTEGSVSITFDVTRASERIDKMKVVKFENGNIIPIDTVMGDNNELIAEVMSGVYGIVDCEYIIRNMNIYIADYVH